MNKIQQPKTREQLTKEEEKNLHSQMEAYIEVAKHKLGRTPTVEELIELMSSKEEEPVEKTEDLSAVVAPDPQAVPGVVSTDELSMSGGLDAPALTQMLVYYGMSDNNGTRAPDPSKILFYEDPLTGACYDTNLGEWSDERPSMLDHLMSRPIQNDENDILSAIAHGIVSDEDFEMLDRAGLIGETPKKIFQIMTQMQQDMDMLEELKMQSSQEQFDIENLQDDGLMKSDDGELAEESEPEDEEWPEDDFVPQNVEDQNIPSNGDHSELMESEGIIDEIIKLACEAAQSQNTRELEPLIRKICREEILKYVNEPEEEEDLQPEEPGLSDPEPLEKE